MNERQPFLCCHQLKINMVYSVNDEFTIIKWNGSVTFGTYSWWTDMAGWGYPVKTAAPAEYVIIAIQKK